MYETHPSLSPALLLPSLVFSLGKLCKNLSSLCQCSDCPCLSLFYPPSTSSPQHSRAASCSCAAPGLYIPGFQMEAPLFSSPAFFFSVSSHFAPLLLFSAFLPCCLPWHRLHLTLLPPLSHFCLRAPCLWFPSHTCTHTHPPLLCPPSPPRSLF